MAVSEAVVAAAAAAAAVEGVEGAGAVEAVVAAVVAAAVAAAAEVEALACSKALEEAWAVPRLHVDSTEGEMRGPSSWTHPMSALIMWIRIILLIMLLVLTTVIMLIVACNDNAGNSK